MYQDAKLHRARAIRKRRKNAAPIFGLWLFLLFICLLAAYTFMHSSYFSISRIDVVGNEQIMPEEIIKQSGLTLGTNLFQVNTAEALHKLVLNPLLKQAEIKRGLPSRLVVTVSERKAVAFLVGKNGLMEIDDEAVYLKNINKAQDIQLPIISGVLLTGNELPGAKLSTPGLMSALALIKHMDKVFFDNVAEIIAPTANSLTLRTLQGVEIRFGEAVDLERKVKTIQELLIRNGTIINNQTVEYIDLRYDTSPVIKRKT